MTEKKEFDIGKALSDLIYEHHPDIFRGNTAEMGAVSAKIAAIQGCILFNLSLAVSKEEYDLAFMMLVKTMEVNKDALKEKYDMVQHLMKMTTDPNVN